MYLSEKYNKYKDLFKKYNLSLSDLDKLDSNYKILLIEEQYDKGNRKNFPRVPTILNKTEISAEQYAMYLSSIYMFKDRVENNYTSLGYKPVRLTSVNPDRTLKVVRSFYFELKDK